MEGAKDTTARRHANLLSGANSTFRYALHRGSLARVCEGFLGIQMYPMLNIWSHLGALPRTEDLTLGQGFSAQARDESLEAGFISQLPKSLHSDPLHRAKGETWARWLMPVILTPS